MRKVFSILIVFAAIAGASLMAGTSAVFAENDNDIVLEVYEDSELKGSFTESELYDVWDDKYYSYSAYNTFPTFKLIEGAGGPLVKDILENSDIDVDAIGGNQIIEFESGDYVRRELLMSQILENRYYFPNGSKEFNRAGQSPLPESWESSSPVPAILTLEADDDNNVGRLLIGQVSPNEQTYQVSVQNVICDVNPGKIIVHSEEAGKFNPIDTTNIGTGGTVQSGTSVTLNRSVNPDPVGSNGRYTVYFTTDGTEPDPSSKTAQLYNYNNYFFGESNEKINRPVIPQETITVTTKVFGYGKQPSEPSTFTFKGVPAPAAVSGLRAVTTSLQGLSVSWRSVSGANGYEVYRSMYPNSGYSLMQRITSESVCSYANGSGLKTGATYYYRVRAYKIVDGKTFYGNWAVCAGVPTLKTNAITKLKVKKKKITVSWTKTPYANGYQIFRATSYNGSYKCVKTIKKQKTTKWKNSKLKKKTTYYYKVRSYKVISGKKVYSGFSAVKYARTK